MHKICEPVTVVANGTYPSHHVPIKILNNSKTIVSCDGATNSLEKNNIKPDIIIGDMDSIENDLLLKYRSICILDSNQDQNDLRKALIWLNKKNIASVNIIGATGKRDDHAIANILSLLEMDWNNELFLYTNYGVFTLINGNHCLESYIKQQVSIFFLDNTIKFSTKGLKYKLKNQTLSTRYMGALNESTGSSISLEISNGKALVFQSYKK